MTKRTLFVAGVFSLFLVGTWGTARANDNDTSSKGAPPGVVSMFGKHICLAVAPPDAECDWRMPRLEANASIEASAQPAWSKTSFFLLGQRFCLGDTANGHCDVRLPANSPRQDTEPNQHRQAMKPKVLHVMGVSFCFGDVSANVDCDMKLALPPSEQG